MSAVLSALVQALGQLTDRAVLGVAGKSIAITLLLFALGGAGLWWGLDAALETWLIEVLPDGYEGPAAALLAVFVWLVGFWLLFRVVALAVLQFFADEIVAAVEARHYPALAVQAKALPFHRDLSNSVRGLLRALGYNLLALPVAALVMFTAIGPALVFLAVNAVLLGRELTDMAWLRHHSDWGGDDVRGNPVGRGERLLLGAAIAGMMLVPLANLLAPVIGAAAGTHLVLRRLVREAEA
jgi:uncharacterized protein involved in cysteine biosynthesis